MTEIKNRVNTDRVTYSPLRVTHKGKIRKIAASLRVDCGCSDNDLVIFPLDTDDPDDSHVVINGVNGTVDQWQQIFGPLLNMAPKE